MGIIQDLIKQGYDLKGPLTLDTDDLTKMGFTTESINDTPREDKTVVVTSDGKTKRVSSMMFGYNKAKLKLKDGEFANTDELLAAMQEAVARQDKGAIVVNSKGDKLTPEQMGELIDFVAEAAGKVVIGSQSEKITNQEAPTWGVEDPKGRLHGKGAVFLGNGQIKLPSGEYVSVEELEQAISDYVVLVPKKKEEEPVPPKPTDPEPGDPEPTEPDPTPTEPTPEDPEIDKQTVLRVTSKYKNRASIWLAILSAVLAIILAIGIVKKPIEVANTVESTIVAYEMEHGEITQEDIQQIAQDIVNKYRMGEKVYVEDGKEFGVTSNPEETTTKTMGEEFLREGKEQGEYRISGFAVWHEGNIYEFLEDFNGDLTDPSIGEYLDQVCEKHNLPKDQVDFMVHVGTNEDGTRLGWIDVSDLINQDELNEAIVEHVTENTQKFFDRIENFEGSTITLSNGDKISIYKEDGSLVQPGDEINSERGIKYTVNRMELTEKSETFTSVVGEEKQLVFELTAPEIAVAMAPLVAALAFALANHKKNKQAQENPAFVSVANNEEKERFVREFAKAKEEYEKTSSFGKVLKRVFYRKQIDQMQEFTDEQVREIYTVIERHANRDFVLGENDKITIKNGNIYIEYREGGTMNITDIIMEDLYSIGKENEVVEEGLYTDEVRRRF